MPEAEGGECSMNQVLDVVGTHIYVRLGPRDLISLGSCSRRFRDDIVREKLARICALGLPVRLGVRSNYLVEFREGRSFADKEELVDHLLERTEAVGLVIAGARTAEESRIAAREGLLGNIAGSTVRFEAIDSNSSLSPLPPVTAECHYQRSIGRSTASSWAGYSLDRESCRGTPEDREKGKLIKDWLDCLFSRSGTDLGLWRWSCKHRRMSGCGTAGVGVIIASGQETSAPVTVELRLTRYY